MSKYGLQTTERNRFDLLFWTLDRNTDRQLDTILQNSFESTVTPKFLYENNMECFTHYITYSVLSKFWKVNIIHNILSSQVFSYILSILWCFLCSCFGEIKYTHAYLNAFIRVEYTI